MKPRAQNCHSLVSPVEMGSLSLSLSLSLLLPSQLAGHLQAQQEITQAHLRIFSGLILPKAVSTLKNGDKESQNVPMQLVQHQLQVHVTHGTC